MQNQIWFLESGSILSALSVEFFVYSSTQSLLTAYCMYDTFDVFLLTVLDPIRLIRDALRRNTWIVGLRRRFRTQLPLDRHRIVSLRLPFAINT